MSSHLNLFFLILLLSGPTNGRHSSYDVVSDGGVQQVHASPYLALNSLSAAGSSCDEAYGFLPCTTSVLGNLFLILVYGYFMFLAATYLSDGSELLLEILGTGIVGGLLLPILGAAPESLIILDRIWSFWNYSSCSKSSLCRNGLACWVNCYASYNNMGIMCYSWQV